MYYSEGQVNHTIWPNLTMLKIIKFLLLQRFGMTLLFLFGLVLIICQNFA